MKFGLIQNIMLYPIFLVVLFTKNEFKNEHQSSSFFNISLSMTMMSFVVILLFTSLKNFKILNISSNLMFKLFVTMVELNPPSVNLTVLFVVNSTFID